LGLCKGRLRDAPAVHVATRVGALIGEVLGVVCVLADVLALLNGGVVAFACKRRCVTYTTCTRIL
jgi:hypothetical protein